MLPAHLIVDFWATVRTELTARHDLGDPEADRAISAYRTALERHQVGDMVYHRDPEAVADTIAGGRQTGFADPPGDIADAG